GVSTPGAPDPGGSGGGVSRSGASDVSGSGGGVSGLGARDVSGSGGGETTSDAPDVEVRWTLARTDRPDAGSEQEASALLHCVVRSTDADSVGRRFSNAAIELALASYPGFHVTAPPSKGSPYGVFTAAHVPAEEVRHVAVLADGTRIDVAHAPSSQVLE